ncbi:MAG: signal recognition particle protein [Rickettsiales bacterium]
MFDSLSKRLSASFDKLRSRGTLSEADVDAALRDIRMALIEADVALPVAKEFIASLKEKIVGEKIVASVSPGQMVVKLVHDALVQLLGSETAEINLHTSPPAVILMCGLQGSGKTTSTGKLAKRLKEKQRKKVLVASLDIYRPAAQEQLATVAKAADVTSLPIVVGEKPETITMRALQMARTEGYDVLLLDTAGRLHIDDVLMDELKAVRDLAKPIETLLVADSLTGQDAVNIAKAFHESIGVTGIILTRLDGDGRGGAALSMKHITGQPIKFAGMGEKLDEFEVFHPERIASRILDMGDVVSFVEKAAENFSEQDAKAAMEKMQSGKFDMNDMLQQMKQIQKMGGMGAMLNMLPGAAKIQEAMKGQSIDEKRIKHQEAMILSMTKAERANPNLLNASRRRRIAIGAGRTVQELNQLIKQYQQMETMMKQMKKMGMKGLANPANLKRLFGG